jgi:hypothetical protein
MCLHAYSVCIACMCMYAMFMHRHMYSEPMREQVQVPELLRCKDYIYLQDTEQTILIYTDADVSCSSSSFFHALATPSVTCTFDNSENY